MNLLPNFTEAEITSALAGNFNNYNCENIKQIYHQFHLSARNGNNLYIDLLVITKNEAIIYEAKKNLVTKEDVLQVISPFNKSLGNNQWGPYRGRGYLQTLIKNEKEVIKRIKAKSAVNDNFSISNTIHFVGQNFESCLENINSFEYNALMTLAEVNGFELEFETWEYFHNILFEELNNYSDAENFGLIKNPLPYLSNEDYISLLKES